MIDKKITIGIPTYKQNNLLPETIVSALKQDCKIIVCADGDDEAYEVASKYAVRVIRQVNKGLASARNTILMNCETEWIIFLDSDDIILPNAVERILEVIRQNPNADIIAPSFKEFGLSDREVILMGSPTIEDFKEANRIGYCAAIRRSVLLEVGGYNPKMKWGAEDYDLWFDLLKRGKKLVTIPEVLWMYRTKKNSMWTETQKHYQEFMHQIASNHPEVFR